MLATYEFNSYVTLTQINNNTIHTYIYYLCHHFRPVATAGYRPHFADAKLIGLF